MSMLSMVQAAKIFNVSRPTLSKHREQGKITGQKIDGAWQFDKAELARVYITRAKAAEQLHADFAPVAGVGDTGLQAEIKLLQAKLDAAERLLEERQKHLDDLRGLLTDTRPAERRPWWRW